MSRKPEDVVRPSQPEPEIRYSKKFLRERTLERRKGMRGGGILVLATALMILAESLHAYRTHAWVDLGTHMNTPVLFPPIIGLVIGLLILLLGFYCIWDSFKSGE
ncbi:MAG: hypothetical protein NVS1B6_07220 [Steroidobacteraceae bacterium]